MRHQGHIPLVPLSDPASCRGILRVSRFDGPLTDGARRLHRSSYARGRGCDMEDNDLRGFVDGTFYLGWNQPTQTHVRIGRFGYGDSTTATPADRAPTYGEHEVFRMLQRWDRICLPAGARVVGARLSLTVEWDGPEPRRLLLYAVNKDWHPGNGGVHRNNASVPEPGEVWWNEVSHGESSWGLPGAGLASNTHPEADTPASALADAIFDRSGDTVDFESPELAEYVDGRVNSGEPILFLLKASDFQEDVPGAHLSFYSANSGDTYDLSRRPCLDLEWHHPGEVVFREEPVFLEYGRRTEISLEAEMTGAAEHWVEFDPASGYDPPCIRTAATSPWLPLPQRIRLEPAGGMIQVIAAPAPVTLGGLFEASITDTWLTVGLPEEQKISWEFVSPSGQVHARLADYRGQFTWAVEFHPDEIGPWRYRWSYDFNYPRQGPDARFDAVCDSLTAAANGLDRLRIRIEAAHLEADSDHIERERINFSRLQRVAMNELSRQPAEADGVTQVREQLTAVREALWGRSVPEEIPMRSMAVKTEVDGRPLPEPVLRAGSAKKQPASPAWRRLGRYVRARLRSLAS